MADIETFDVYGVVGEPITLPIGPGPATGYRWSLRMPPSVRQLPDVDPDGEPDLDARRHAATPQGAAAAPDRLGAAPGTRLCVAAEAGEHVVTCSLARPGEDAPVRVVEVRLHVALSEFGHVPGASE